MANQLSALENKYQKLRHIIEDDLNNITRWLDSYVASGGEHNSQLFQQSMDRQFKLKADLERIDARLAAYAQMEPLQEVATAS